MNKINFLPERYHERDLKRKAAVWQYAILLGFGGLLLVATLGQFAMKKSLQVSMRDLQQDLIATKLKRERVQLLKQELGDKEQAAALYTYLRHPWPRTQLIANVTQGLPECISFEGLEILEQQPIRRAASGHETRTDASSQPMAATDLETLRSSQDVARVIVRIRGVVSDTAALNEYVRRLSEVPLFHSVSLSSLQSQASQDDGACSAFELNVIVRPGHGQSGGPKGPIATSEQIAQHSAGGTSL
ncbi:MAG: hypothetical protein H6822_17625 [Planctomycetaceae bacterium]|nr:hypothetical protein [Planctomycetales bacterium]MCB9924007.1 hypothetical protein [Planctomycetaceae bacterium]